jgi:glutamate racemase
MVRIGLCDSGLGGLTIAREVRRQMPNASIEFYGDNGRNPYGPRPREEIVRFTRQMIDFLAKKHVDGVIIACNTATAAALQDVRDAYPFPVIGPIEPGAKAALAASKNKKIGVIATPFTTKMAAYANEIGKIDGDAKVLAQACAEFTLLVESGRVETPEAAIAAENYLSVYKDSGIDTLVLGCTHYPVMIEHVKKNISPDVRIVDPAVETVRLLISLLGSKYDPKEAARPSFHFYTSGDTELFERLGSAIMGMPTGKVEKVVFE